MTSPFQEELTKFLVAEVSQDPNVDIDGSTELLMSGIVDSLGVMTLVDWIETESSIEIDPIDIVLENFRTVDDMIRFISTSRE